MESSSDEHLVVLSGIPVVAQGDQHAQQALSRFLLRKLGERDHNDMAKIYMPVDANGNSSGLAVVRYPSAAAADAGVRDFDGTVLDRGHTMVVERIEGSAVFRALEGQGGIDQGSVRGLVGLRLV